MGRKKSINKNTPPYFFPREGKKRITYYYTRCRPPINLGHDYNQALKKWAELEGGTLPNAKTITYTKFQYFKIKVPDKAISTQKDNDREWKMLEPVFGTCTWESIKRKHIYQYLDSRTGKVRANREIKLLSAMWTFALNRGYTETPNVCVGLEYNKEKGRDKLIDHAEYTAVYNKADCILQDFMDMMLFTGQRNSRALYAKKADIKKVTHPITGNQVDALFFEAQKNGKRVFVVIEGEFQTVIERMMNRKRSAISQYFIADENGQKIKASKIRTLFDNARKASGVNFQLRDIRAKVASDEDDFQTAHDRLAHTTRGMSEQYIKNRKGITVLPAKGIK